MQYWAKNVKITFLSLSYLSAEIHFLCPKKFNFAHFCPRVDILPKYTKLCPPRYQKTFPHPTRMRAKRVPEDFFSKKNPDLK